MCSKPKKPGNHLPWDLVALKEKCLCLSLVSMAFTEEKEIFTITAGTYLHKEGVTNIV